MKRLTAVIIVAATAGSMLSTSAMATTDAGAYGQHETDCLKLLFSDPAAHAAQCGGPFAGQQSPSWIPTSGFGASCPQVGELVPAQTQLPHPKTRTDVLLVAYPATICGHGCAALTSEPWQAPDLIERLPADDRMLVALPPCNN